jgi:hypothetical protein
VYSILSKYISNDSAHPTIKKLLFLAHTTAAAPSQTNPARPAAEVAFEIDIPGGAKRATSFLSSTGVRTEAQDARKRHDPVITNLQNIAFSNAFLNSATHHRHLLSGIVDFPPSILHVRIIPPSHPAVFHVSY